MALRDFRDSKGVAWKVWDVTPESLDRRTAAEDHMHEWQDGWLVFEGSDVRRRLAPYPNRWEELADAELERLLDRAQAVKRRTPGENSAVGPAYGSRAAGAEVPQDEG